jgi:dipeptidyl aminopeptidase/acylaminoacyl peptidase
MSIQAPAPHTPDQRLLTVGGALKLVLAVIICLVVVLTMLTSSEPTVTPAAPATPTPAGTVRTGVAPTVVASPVRTNDTFIPGTLIYVQGHTLYKLQHNNAPVPLVFTATQPAISPDGTQLAYVQVQKNYQDIEILNLKTDAIRALTNDAPTNPIDPRTGLSAGAPAWSDDGQSIYFVWNYPGMRNGSTNNTDFSVYRCSVTTPCTAATAQLINDASFTLTGGDYEPAPRPTDPAIVVYSRYTTNNSYSPPISIPALYAHVLTTGATILLTNLSDAVSQPAWHPTGRYLAFVQTTINETHNGIFVMDFHSPGQGRDYANAHLLVSGAPLVSHPVFSPDGNYLAYLGNDSSGQGFHLYIARVYLGPHPYIEKPQLVQRAGTVDSDVLVWTH